MQACSQFCVTQIDLFAATPMVYTAAVAGWRNQIVLDTAALTPAEILDADLKEGFT